MSALAVGCHMPVAAVDVVAPDQQLDPAGVRLEVSLPRGSRRARFLCPARRQRRAVGRREHAGAEDLPEQLGSCLSRGSAVAAQSLVAVLLARAVGPRAGAQVNR